MAVTIQKLFFINGDMSAIVLFFPKYI